MGMPITVEIADPQAKKGDIQKIYDYLIYVDETFSTYKETSEISQINAGKLPETQWSKDMHFILDICEQTKKETRGYFDIHHKGFIDPSGVVKGWAIGEAANLLKSLGYQNYFVDAGGDIQTAGCNNEGEPWVIGIRNPFNREEIVKRVAIQDRGIATSGTYIRGQHIYDPHQPNQALTEVASLTVIGPNILDADRFATAAFAMGSHGVEFIADLPDFEAYQIDKNGIATFTEGFSHYVL